MHIKDILDREVSVEQMVKGLKQLCREHDHLYENQQVSNLGQAADNNLPWRNLPLYDLLWDVEEEDSTQRKKVIFKQIIRRISLYSADVKDEKGLDSETKKLLVLACEALGGPLLAESYEGSTDVSNNAYLKKLVGSGKPWYAKHLSDPNVEIPKAFENEINEKYKSLYPERPPTKILLEDILDKKDHAKVVVLDHSEQDKTGCTLLCAEVGG